MSLTGYKEALKFICLKWSANYVDMCDVKSQPVENTKVVNFDLI